MCYERFTFILLIMKILIGNRNVNTFWLIAFLFIAIKLLIHIFTASNYELHRDEMLYFNMGDHLDFGYLTVPPVTGFLAAIIKLVFGYSVFGIRLIPAILGSATLFIIAKTVKDFGGKIVALIIASVTFIFIPGFLLIFSLYTPNAIEIFLWSLLIYLFHKLLATENLRLWIWIGIVAGIAFNTKYSVVFPLAGFFVALLIFRKIKLLQSYWFLIGVAAGLMLITPNLFWQYNHNWPVLYHMQQLQKTQLTNLNFFNFFTDQFSLNSMLLPVWLFGLFMLFAKPENGVRRFMATAITTVFILFILMKGKAYYTLGLLPFLIAAGSYYIEKYVQQKSVYITVLTVMTICSLLFLPYVLPVLPFEKLARYSSYTRNRIPAPFIRWEDGKEHQLSQVYADMTGWKEMAEKVAKTYKSLNAEDQKKCTIYCERNYGYAGAIHFYGHPYNLPEPVTFHESYVFWAPSEIPDGPVIYTYYNSDRMQALFNQITEMGTIENPWFRESGVKVFLCTEPKTNIREVYRNLAKNEKTKFQKIK